MGHPKKPPSVTSYGFLLPPCSPSPSLQVLHALAVQVRRLCLVDMTPPLRQRCWSKNLSKVIGDLHVRCLFFVILWCWDLLFFTLSSWSAASDVYSGQSLPCGMEAVLTTDSLSPNIMVAVSTVTPRYRKVFRRSMICSVHVLAAEHSDPNVAVSAVDCNFENWSMSVLLARCRIPVTDLQLIMSW